MSHLRVEDHGPVRHLVIDRPDKRNALTHRFYRELTEALDAAATVSDVRCLVLRGEGRVFSAGHDVHELAELSADPDRLRPVRPVWLRALNRLEDVATPTVACVRGPCIGAGAELALACDMRVMATDAAVSFAETRLGLVPDLGGSSRLPALVGLGRAKEMILTARRVDAEEAGRIGLANRVATPAGLDAALQDLIEPLLANPTSAIGAAKRVLDAGAKPTLAATQELEGVAQDMLIRTHEFRDRLAAATESEGA